MEKLGEDEEVEEDEEDAGDEEDATAVQRGFRRCYCRRCYRRRCYAGRSYGRRCDARRARSAVQAGQCSVVHYSPRGFIVLVQPVHNLAVRLVQ
jgi:hypothetical protein